MTRSQNGRRQEASLRSSKGKATFDPLGLDEAGDTAGTGRNRRRAAGKSGAGFKWRVKNRVSPESGLPWIFLKSWTISGGVRAA